MTLALPFLLAAATAMQAPPTAPPSQTAAPPLAAIGRQSLPDRGCAAYLWSLVDRQLVAMAVADPPHLRLALDGRSADYARVGEGGAGSYGLGGSGEYRGGDVIATLDMSVTTRAEMTGGASVPTATLRIERAGRDTLVVPLAGLIGCR